MTPLAPCPVEQAIQIIGGKWKLLILRSLLLTGPQRYNELLANVTGISAKELTRNTADLAASQLIAKDATHYSLTELGQQLMPTFQTLLTWGQKLMAATNIPVR